MRKLISKIAVDTRALRESRDFRLLTIGSVVTGLGTQAALVALPYQVYVTTRSAFLTGLLGAVELGPLIALSLFGGALADRFDRRRLLLATQVALVAVASGLAAAAILGSPALWLLYLLAGLGTAASAVERVTRSAMVPNLVSPERLRGALSLTFGLYQLTMVLGPGLGGLLISAAGVEGAYIADAVTCAGMVLAAYLMRPQPPGAAAQEEREPIFRSIATGLRFVRGERALVGSFVIDLCAMTFGMPRALFPVLSLTVYHSGARDGRAVLGRRRGRHRGGAHHRLARARAMARPDRARRRGRLGRRDRPGRGHDVARRRGRAAGDRGRGRQRERRLPFHHLANAHA